MIHTTKSLLQKITGRVILDLVILGVALGLFMGGVLILWITTFKIPDIDSFEGRKIEQSTKIYDRTGEVLLYDVHKNITRTVISFDDISRHIKNAAVAIEDSEFYEHNGIKPQAILRAIFANVSSVGLSQGGSTITQQVIKNSVLTQEKKISRKLKEWVLSLRLEQLLSKEEILALYLNESPYGGTLYGVEEAAQAFFGVSAKDLSLAQAAYLAALPQAPTFYSPYGNNIEALEARKELVLRRMLEENFISGELYEEAREERVIFLPRPETGIKAPHFVLYVRELLEEQYGIKRIEEEGLTIITSLDIELQEKAEEIVKEYALQNAEKFNAENASLTALDPKTGEVLVMVGSRDYFDEEIDGNFNVALAHRQPGSAFKPIVYATAFARGYTPDTVVFDLETEFSTNCTVQHIPLGDGAPCYHPQNYDDTFRGPVTLREALAQSMNVPAVKTLYLAGLDASLRTAQAMGIQSLGAISQYGLTLVLGGGEVTPLEMTSVYATFASGGVRNDPSFILRVEAQDGTVLEENTPQNRRVLRADVAYQISDILSDDVSRTPAFGANSLLHFPGSDVAVKTGTTNDYRDAWIVGYTPHIAVGAWAGNNDNSPMEKRVAGFIIAPLWNAFMQEVLRVYPAVSFPEPPARGDVKPVLKGVWEGGESYVIDRISGKLATEWTPQETQEVRIVPNIHSILHWIDRKNPQGNASQEPQRDPQYHLWEYPVQQWARTRGFASLGTSTLPSDTDDVHTKKTQPRAQIRGLDDGLYQYDERIVLRVDDDNSVFGLQRMEVFVNDVYVGQTGAPLRFSFTPQETTARTGENTLRIVVTDTVFNRTELETTFRVRN